MQSSTWDQSPLLFGFHLVYPWPPTVFLFLLYVNHPHPCAENLSPTRQSLFPSTAVRFSLRCVSRRGRGEARSEQRARKREGLCFANDFGTNRTQHAFCFAAFASFALLVPKKRDSCSVFALTSIERTIGRFSEWLDEQSDEIRSPEYEADTGYE